VYPVLESTAAALVAAARMEAPVQHVATSRTITLEQLAGAVTGATIIGPGGRGAADIAAAVVTELEYDSRRITPGALFVAVRGGSHDGHRFLPQVIASGAAAVVVQADRVDLLRDLPVPAVVVPDCRAALAPLACRFWGDPTRRLFLAGVTGTNGKTTTVRMIDSISRAAGEITGTIGTLGATVAGRSLPGEHTTPEAPDLQRLFAEMLDAGAKSAAIEVSSHALVSGRTEGCLFDVAVFTNLTQDHLDFHGTMDSYRDAKGTFFSKYVAESSAAGKNVSVVLNLDDAAGRHYLDLSKPLDKALPICYCTKETFDAQDAARFPVFCCLTYEPKETRIRIDRISFRVRRWQRSIPRLKFDVEGEIDIDLPFGGAFNVQNALAAVGYGIARELDPAVIAAGLANCPPVPGRFQPVRAGQDFAVLVDYAHTPDGLENVLRSARPLTSGRLIAVFGCGGDRDRTKRPIMGRLAHELADVAVVTSDNPRNEEPADILDGILAGMGGEGDGRAVIHREVDRRGAIAYAVRCARPGDTVVIAGKGHENYQILKDRTIHFDDVEVAREEIGRL
jgi:UDP-N-acetylmuramyl-tripeptide synthetase